MMKAGLINPKLVLDEKYVFTEDARPSINRDKQLQQSGIDLRLHSADRIHGSGILSEDKNTTKKPELVPMQITDNHYMFFAGNSYSLTFIEDVNIPKDAAALVIHRSSVNRFFGTIHSGLYDAGFYSKGGCGAVFRPSTDVSIEVGTRLAQIIFFSAESATMYDGQYQGT